MTDERWSIGEVSRRTGVAPSALRYYEALGLLPAPARVGGRRAYPPEVVSTLGVIRTGRAVGLTLAQIGELLERSRGGAAGTHLAELADRRLPEVEAQIAEATRIRHWMTAARECRCETLEACGLFTG